MVAPSEPRRKRAIKGNNSGGGYIVPVAGVDTTGLVGPRDGSSNDELCDPCQRMNDETPSRCRG